MPKQILTRSRAAWAKQFQVPVVKGGLIVPNAGVTDWYRTKMERLIFELNEETQKEIVRVFRAEGFGYAMDASLPSQARITLNRLKGRMEAFLAGKAKDLAEQMLGRANRANSATVHESLKDMSGGLSLKTSTISGTMRETMKAIIGENVSLIRSIGATHHSKVEGAVMRSIVQGRGLADLVPEIHDIGGVSLARARIIALDQTKKANTIIGAQRMLDLGISWAEWMHSPRSKIPRTYHAASAPAGLNGLIFRLDDPPVIDQKTGEKGMPGQLPGCNCLWRPALRFDGPEEAP